MVRRKLSFGKKGFGFVNIILGLVFIIAAVALAIPVYKALTAKKDVDICRASVSVKATSVKLTSFGTGLVDPVQLNFDCHTATLVVKNDGVYDINGKPDSKFSEQKYTGRTYEDKLKLVVADSMAQCWDMFLRGEVDPFTRLDGTEHCVMCYDILFDETAKDKLRKDSETKTQTTLNGFNKFLLDNYYSKNERYSEMIYGIGPNDAKAADFVKNSPKLDVGTQYAVVFYSGRGNSIADAAAKVAKIVGGAIIGKGLAFIIKKPVDALTHLVGVAALPLNEVADKCARLY